MQQSQWNMWLIFWALIFLISCNKSNAFEPITTAVIGGLTAAGILKWEPATDFVLGRFMERCSDRSIPMNVAKLRNSLYDNLFGQHIVQKIVIKALESHKYYSHTSKKPLVMSFHGTPGTGKNFVADMIAKFLYDKGLESKFVHKYSGKLHFSQEYKVHEYSEVIKHIIIDGVKNCERSLFIFDEVDSIPKGVFDTITALLDHHELIDGVDFRKAIFIFLSNHGGVEISDRLFDLYRNKHKDREDTTLQDYEDILQLAAFNKEGGLQHARPIEHGLIDHFVPFLPLERRHVRQCIETEYKRLRVNPTEQQINALFQFVTFERQVFAKNGCKKITKKAEIYV